jgi:predicted AlkP superfamily phosphohydrolase/phosphomutase
LAAGELPNIARLRASGGFGRVATTSPAQTPVAWSSFATGCNPGKHRIFDFLRRDPKTYLPDLGLNEYEQKNPFVPPKAVNLRRGTTVWDHLGKSSIPSIILRCPCSYPPDAVRHRMLSGMGVPDVRGGLGTPTYFTTATDDRPRESEQMAVLQPVGDGTFRTSLAGPRNPKDRSDMTVELRIEPDHGAGGVRVSLPGAAPLDVTLGKWSDWLAVKFKTGLLLNVRGMVRFTVLSLEPELRLYASPVNFDPEAPLFPISHPPEYARELADAIGPYYTTGMVEDHTGLNNERLSADAFLQQCNEVWNERAAMMEHELARHTDGLFYCLFDTPDRAQHLFWRFREPAHPSNRGRDCHDSYARVVDDQYRTADRVLGRALEHADNDTLVITLSDHGFGSFQRCVELNTWLYEHKLLTLKEGRSPGEHAGELLQGVDWSKTQAYAIGLSGIYINLQGREGQGTVRPDDSEHVRAEIAAGLQALRDNGHSAIRAVVPREQAYHGPYISDAPDLLVHFAAGYRVGWSSAMGGVGQNVLSDNTKPWSGDHIVDPALVPGFLAMNRSFNPSARLIDLAPTILQALGAPPCPDMEGNSLL